MWSRFRAADLSSDNLKRDLFYQDAATNSMYIIDTYGDQAVNRCTLYFAPPHATAVPYMESGHLGWIDTPDQCNQGGRPNGVVWIADNGCFGKKALIRDVIG